MVNRWQVAAAGAQERSSVHEWELVKLAALCIGDTVYVATHDDPESPKWSQGFAGRLVAMHSVIDDDNADGTQGQVIAVRYLFEDEESGAYVDTTLSIAVINGHAWRRL